MVVEFPPQSNFNRDYAEGRRLNLLIHVSVELTQTSDQNMKHENIHIKNIVLYPHDATETNTKNVFINEFSIKNCTYIQKDECKDRNKRTTNLIIH